MLSLLRARGLLLDGLRDHLLTTLVVSQDNLVVGSAALEMYANGALLRSVAVVESMQGHGLGQAAHGGCTATRGGARRASGVPADEYGRGLLCETWLCANRASDCSRRREGLGRIHCRML